TSGTGSTSSSSSSSPAAPTSTTVPSSCPPVVTTTSTSSSSSTSGGHVVPEGVAHAPDADDGSKGHHRRASTVSESSISSGIGRETDDDGLDDLGDPPDITNSAPATSPGPPSNKMQEEASASSIRPPAAQAPQVAPVTTRCGATSTTSLFGDSSSVPSSSSSGPSARMLRRCSRPVCTLDVIGVDSLAIGGTSSGPSVGAGGVEVKKNSIIVEKTDHLADDSSCSISSSGGTPTGAGAPAAPTPWIPPDRVAPHGRNGKTGSKNAGVAAKSKKQEQQVFLKAALEQQEKLEEQLCELRKDTAAQLSRLKARAESAEAAKAESESKLANIEMKMITTIQNAGAAGEKMDCSGGSNTANASTKNEQKEKFAEDVSDARFAEILASVLGPPTSSNSSSSSFANNKLSESTKGGAQKTDLSVVDMQEEDLRKRYDAVRSSHGLLMQEHAAELAKAKRNNENLRAILLRTCRRYGVRKKDLSALCLEENRRPVSVRIAEISRREEDGTRDQHVCVDVPLLPPGEAIESFGPGSCRSSVDHAITDPRVKTR
ncbi:unnamed protein product, partial [Amoebophrya sp. A25]